MKRLTLILFLFFVGNFQFLNAQEFADKKFYLIDSLKLETLSKNDRELIDTTLKKLHLLNKNEDTSKVKLLSHIVEECWNDEVWPKYNEYLYLYIKTNLKSNKVTKKEKNFYYDKLASSINNKGYFYSSKGDFELAINYYLESVKIQKKLNNLTSVGKTYNNIGRAYVQRGEVSKALDYYYLALKIFEPNNDIENIGLITNNIGLIYAEQEDYKMALKYFKRNLKTMKKLNNPSGISLAYNNIGYVYSKLPDYETALENYKKCLEIRETMGNKKLIAYSLNNIGFIYSNLEKTKDCFSYFEKSLAILEKIKDNNGLVFAYTNLANIYLKKNNLKKAEYYANKSIQIAKESESPLNIRNSAEILYKLNTRKGNYKDGLKYHELFVLMQDSIKNEKNRKDLVKQNLQYEYDKKLLADSIKNVEKEKIIQAEIAAKDEKIKRQTTERYGLSGGVLVLLLFGSVIFKKYKESQKQKKIINTQKEIVEAKTKEITDSINYAKNIQNSILPTEEEFESTLKNSFIYYQPKDIVAGDFYWMEKLPSGSFEGSEIIYFAAADCTGHGVPGAMVSVVCNGALNRAIGEYNLKQPAEILNKVRELVIKTFDRSGDDSKLRDGMDIALCSLKFDDSTLKKTESVAKLQYAGANNPLWIVRPINNLKPQTLNFELIEVKADKQPIGKHFRQNDFTNHTVSLQKGDTIYIFTDGYADQFGGPKGKKMMYKPFKELLLSIQEKSMQEQRIILEQHFQNWKGDLEQIDDVCIIGVRI